MTIIDIRFELENGVEEDFESVRKEDEVLIMRREHDGFSYLRSTQMVKKDVVQEKMRLWNEAAVSCAIGETEVDASYTC